VTVPLIRRRPPRTRPTPPTSRRARVLPEVDWDALMPTVVLMVHVYVGDEETGVARVEGHGPVTEAWLRSHLGPYARFDIRPALDIAGQARWTPTRSPTGIDGPCIS
jgi:hypothetical protein